MDSLAPSHLPPLGAITRIYVNRVAIERNMTEGRSFPPICIRHADGRTEHANRVQVAGPCEIVYDPEGLHDGTKVWVETTAPVATTI